MAGAAAKGRFFIPLLGIDVGTGGTRAIVVDHAGRVLASVTHEHLPFVSPRTGWAEQHPSDWWNATQIAIRKSMQEAKLSGAAIDCIGLSGQMHGAVLLDKEDQILRPALIWCDQRTQAQCKWLNRNIGEQRLIELTSNPALTNFTLTKLLWTRDHEPHLYSRIRKVMCPKDYVRWKLTGEHAIDVQEASGTLLLDVSSRQWSKDLLRMAEVDERWLPRLFESPEVCGRISQPGSESTGLRTGTPVVAGAGDQGAGAVGLGITRPGAVSATIGTSGVVFAATDRPAVDPRGRLHTFCHAMPGRWHVMGVTQSAGLSLRWFRDTFGAGLDQDHDSYERLTEEAAKAPPGCDGVIWAPYLMGERTPHLDPDARAALVGLAANHGRAHVIRAIMEGVSFSLRDTFHIFAELPVPVTSIRLSGGGARSKLWRQIQADVYQHVVEIVETEEGAAYGAALLAGVGARIWPDVDAACDACVRVTERISPQLQASQILKEQYQAYRSLYPALKAVRKHTLSATTN